MPPDEEGLLEEEESTQEQTTAEPARPDWLPEQFADERALAESYREAQRKISQQGQELAAERQRREELEALTEQQRAPAYQQPATEVDMLVSAYERAEEEGDSRAKLAITARLNELQLEARFQQQQSSQPGPDLDQISFNAEQRVRTKHGEAYDKYKDEVVARLQADPSFYFGDEQKNLTLADVEKGIETALAFVQRDHLVQETAGLAQKQTEAEAARLRKLEAQSATGAGPRPAPRGEAEKAWERIVNAPNRSFSGA